MPWKNGKGETVEIARSPAAGTGLDDFDWRVSAAPVVADGPFSTFPGILRTIVVIEGKGMELSLSHGRKHLLLPGEPFTYDGGMAVHGRLLDGPVRDLNLMVRQATHRGTLLLADGRIAHSGRAGIAIAFALSQSWRWNAAGGGLGVEQGDALLLEGAAAGAFEPSSPGARLALAGVWTA
jgi:hypothetical protein